MASRRSGEPRDWVLTNRSLKSPQSIFARDMRRQPTDAEKKLWLGLRRLPRTKGHFRRQVQIGIYVADFVSHNAKLVIEVDGGQHNENDEDRIRTDRFEADGYRVLRFWNNDVLLNIDGVLHEIYRAMISTLTPDPSPQGGGEK